MGSILYTGTRRTPKALEHATIVHAPLLSIQLFDLCQTPLSDTLKTIPVGTHKSFILTSRHAAMALITSNLVSAQDPDLTFWCVGTRLGMLIERHFPQARVIVPNKIERSCELLKVLQHTTHLTTPTFLLTLKDSALSIADALIKARPKHRIVAIDAYHTTPDQAFSLSTLCQAHGTFSWIVLTSPRGVDAFQHVTRGQNMDHTQFAAIGQTTAKAMEDIGLQVSYIPPAPNTHVLLTELIRRTRSTSS